MQFGWQLKIARGRAGLTQQTLATPDLTKSFISLLEGGRSYPSVETVIALARRLHASVASLLLDPADLRVETALNLLHLAWAMDPVSRGKSVIQLTATAEGLLPDMPADLRVRVALIRARVAMAASRMDEAARWTDEAAAIARRQRLSSALGRALAIKGILEERRGAFQAAVPVLERAIEILRKTKSIRSEEGVWALLSLGVARARTGEVGHARRAYRRALELATRLRLSMLCGRALTGLGMMEWARQRLDLAVDFLDRAYHVFEQLEDLAEMSRVLTNLGRIRLQQGLYREALAVLEKALRLREHQADIRGRSATRDEIARVLLAMGRYGDAGRSARRAIKDARAAQDEAREAVAHATLARILVAQKRRRKAAGVLGDAVAKFKRLGMTQETASGLAELAALLDAGGQKAAAGDEPVRALNVSLETGGPRRARAAKQRSAG